MPQIVVKGIDSAEAMDQIERLLGPDAMILETVRRNNMIEITATDEFAPRPTATVKQTPPPMPEQTGGTEFAAMLAQTLKKQYEDTPHAASADTDRPLMQRGYARPDQTPQDPQVTATPAKDAVKFDLTCHVLVGPKGAGKTQLALQIAENILAQDIGRPRLVFLGNGSVADAAYLTQKAKILGIQFAAYSYADLFKSPPFDMERDIIVWSADVDVDPSLSIFDSAHMILCLPSGLSPRARLVCCETWGYCSDVVISQSTALPADADDVSDLIDTQWRVLAISDKGRILNGLHAPHHLMMQTQTPTTTAKDTSPIRVAKTDALPSMLRKRWGGDTAPLPSEKPSRIVPMLNTSRRSAHPNHSHRDGAKS